jgi:hypothetical protein
MDKIDQERQLFKAEHAKLEDDVSSVTNSLSKLGVCSVLNNDHHALFIKLCIEEIFGPSPEKLAQPQYCNLKLDDPRISEEYRKILQKKFECHNIYRWVREISVRGKNNEWSLQDEAAYELLDKEINEAMLHTERMCASRKQQATSWKASISKATHTIRYWDARLARKGVRDNQDVIINYYLAHSDILRDARSNGTLYELEVAEARVERKHPIINAYNE